MGPSLVNIRLQVRAKNTLSDFFAGGCLIGEMQPRSDAKLLRDYAERGLETAFAEIVARHTDLVYSAALRQVYSPDLARDVTQSVFTDLSRKAREVSFKLAPEASLVGWLYRGTRFAARDLNRGEIRRNQRERLAMEQLYPAPEPAPDWDQLRPALDDAMAELDDTERDALLLRYFKNHDLRTVGATLGISDDAAQKRVSRAVERLREFFAKRGITVGASGLAVVISANAVQAAPAGLALTISTAAALTGSTLATTATVTATKALAMTALQKTTVTATIAVLAGAGIYEAHQASKLRNQVQILQQQQALLTEQIEQLQSERDNATNQVERLAEEMAKAKNNSSELLRLRGEITVLRQQLLAKNTPPSEQASEKASENSPPADLAKQLALAIIQGDPTALEKLNEYGKSQGKFYITNRVGLSDDESAALSNKVFGGIMKAFDLLSAEAAKGNTNAMQAIEQALQMGSLEGAAVGALGDLAGRADEKALEILLNPERYGLLLSPTIGALQPAADNGNERAIAALASILGDETKKPLWHMASQSLQKAAASGDPVAIAALRSMMQRQ